MALVHSGCILLFTTPSADVLSVCISIGGWGCHIFSRRYLSRIAYFALMKRAPSSASAADDMTAFMIFATLIMSPLFVGFAVFCVRKWCPPAWLRALGLLRYEVSLWMASTMSLTLYEMTASSWEAA